MRIAVALRRGCIFERMGPVASAENTFIELPTIEGRMAMVKKTIPRPPIHCDSDRQASIAWWDSNCASTSLSIEAPVVVKPDIVSKKASVVMTIWASMSKNSKEPKKPPKR